MSTPENAYLAGAGLSSESASDTVPSAERAPYTHPHAHRPTDPETPRGGLSAGFWILALIAVIVLAVVIVLGILSRAAAEHKLEHEAVQSSIPTVEVTHPSVTRLSPEVALPGNAQAFVDTPIYSRSDGYLKNWYYDIGAHVKKGDLLAVIETPELDQQLQVAEANLKSSQANLDLANITSNRYQNLLKSNSVSKQETDQAIGDAAAKQAAVEASQAAVRRLQQLQSFERIYAPFDGIVTVRNTDIGQLVQGGSSNALFHLAAIGTIRVFVPVPENYADDIKDGEHAGITLDEYPGKTFDGTVARNSHQIDASTRTLNVEVDLPNPDGLVLPGAYVFVHLQVPDHGESLTIPSNTLLFRAQGPQVAVVRDGRIALVGVKIAHDAGAVLEISGSLKGTDQIVVNPSDSIAAGQQVHVTGKKAEPEAKAGKE